MLGWWSSVDRGLLRTDLLKIEGCENICQARRNLMHIQGVPSQYGAFLISNYATRIDSMYVCVCLCDIAIMGAEIYL